MLYPLLYRAGTGAYFLGIRLAALFTPKARLFLAGRRGLLSRITTAMITEQRPRIWIHCASLGEFEQGRPIIEQLRQQYPDYALILTFFSPSGYEVRRNFGGVDYVFYLPVDTPGNAARFLNALSPALCVFIKYELWYFYLKGLQQRNIPALLVSAVFRAEQGFFQWYGGLQRRMLRTFQHIFVQDARSEQLLRGVGITSVTVAGDTRFDRVIKAAETAGRLERAAAFCKGSKVIVAGSTWTADEALLAAALPLLPTGWKLILVPHEVDDHHLKEIEKRFDGRLHRWSEKESPTQHPVLLIDTVGLLMNLYSYGQVAWIGGGFGKAGVHNVLEPAVYGIPCLFGPIYHQFIEAAALVHDGGAEVIETPTAFAEALHTYNDAPDLLRLTGIAARDYVLSHSGATNRVMSYIAGLLGDV